MCPVPTVQLMVRERRARGGIAITASHNPALAALCELVRREGCDVGFAQDMDADRLAVVNERGEPVGEKYTLALAARYVLGREPGPLVANLATTVALDAVAARFGCPVYRPKIGEANVAEEMLRRGAVIGGEGNGGVIYPRINFARDSLVEMALILHLLAETGATVSELLAELPPSYMFKEKMACRSDRIGAALRALREAYAGLPQDLRDGVRVQADEGWFLVRGSNTEPIIRLVAEGPTEEGARALIEGVRARVLEVVGRRDTTERDEPTRH